MKKFFTIAALQWVIFIAQAQDCNCLESTNSLTVNNEEVVILNAYYSGGSNALTGSVSIDLGPKRSPSGVTDLSGTIESGDLLMIIQMQGVEIDASLPDMETTEVGGGAVSDTFDFTNYGDGSGGRENEGFIDNSNYIAGQYEFVLATNSVGASGGVLTIEEGLENSYISDPAPTANGGRRTYQVIKVANYKNLTLEAGGEITTVPWNGSTGGIVAIDALGTLQLDGLIDVDFAGFRGGLLDPLLDNSDTQPQAGWRGEGIAGSPTQVLQYTDDFSGYITNLRGLPQGYPGISVTENADFDFGGPVISFDLIYTNEIGPGAPGNAGGGGLINNGGGGGSSGGSGGNGATSGNGSGGDFLIPSGGGAPLSLELGSRIFLGGGGGSGGIGIPSNEGFPLEVHSGHPGGGAVLIRADTLTGSGIISANGDDGSSFNATGVDQADQNGAGGGGGGAGTIVLVTSSSDISGITFNAIGGDGSSLTGIQQFASPDGGGGGGSGGNVILVRRGGAFSPQPANIDVSGGAAGATQGTPNAQSEGGDGATELLTTPPASNLDCPLITLAAAAPGGVSDAIVWFNPNQNVTFDGSGQISGWTDFSSSNFRLTNNSISGISGTTPDYQVGSFTANESTSNAEFNYNSSISFNEDTDKTDYLAFTNFTNIDPSEFTLFAVANLQPGSPDDQVIISYLSSDATSDELDFAISNDSGMDDLIVTLLGNTSNRGGDLRDGITHILTTDYDNAVVNLYVDNGSPTSFALSAATLGTAGTFVIGQDLDQFSTPIFDNARSFQSQLGDVIFFSRALNGSERQQVASYLAIKYGITLEQVAPQDYLNSIGEAIFPVFSEATKYGLYSNDIAGIGRDDGSRLNQLRSKSIHTDAILTASLDAFGADRQYMIWGNDNGAFSFGTLETSLGIITRLGREWRVAVSNSVGPVNITFDLSGTTNTPLFTDNLALIVDDDGDFSNGFLRQIAATTWDGAIATFKDLTLNDDEVITIASVPNQVGGVTGLTLWLRADAGITGTDPITEWADQSGNGNNAVIVANGPEILSNEINFNPALNFDDVNTEYLRGPNGGFNTTSYYIVFKPDVQITGSTPGQTLVGFDTPSATNNVGGLVLGVATGAVTDESITHLLGGSGTTFRRAAANLILAADQPHLIVVRDNESMATNSQLILGGSRVANLQSGVFISETDQNFDLARFNTGNIAGATNYFNGKIAEILSYSTRPDDTDHQQIQSYLAIKYGITLDGDVADYIASDGDFIYETVITPDDYNFDIAGIGRDDVSSLDQRKTISANSDAIVTIALTDNGGSFSSPNMFTSNLSFLAWGNDNDDNGVIEDVNTEVPSNILTRLDREWRVQEKGSVGSVTITVDLSGIDPEGVETDFANRSANSFKILIDDGGDFSNGITRSFDPVSYDAANEVLTFEVDFLDGDIFTIATSRASTGPGGIFSNLELWLRADIGTDNTTDGLEVSTWMDQSINAYIFSDTELTDAIDGGPSYMNPVNKEFNQNPYLVFNAGTNSENLAFSGFNFPVDQFTTFTVFSSDASGDGHLVSYYSGGDQLNIHAPDALKFELQDLTDVEINRNIADGNAHILTFGTDATIIDGPSNIYVDGAPELGNPFNFTSGVPSPFISNGTLSLGQKISNESNGNFGANQHFVGNLAEVILIGNVLSDAERNKIESYLAIKYGITLDNGGFDYLSSEGTIIFPGSSSSAFQMFGNDIAGIGRDDNSLFNQSDAQSINSASILRIIKNSVFTANNQWIVWGHNGNEIASNTANTIPSGIESRLSRIWKFKLTSAPSGTIDMKFDLSEIGFAEAEDLRILVDSDGDFSNATILSPMVVQNGNIYTFSEIDMSHFQDEDVFTIGSVDSEQSPLPLNWLSFNVWEDKGKVKLSWTTTNEINASHFEIERSRDGFDFIQINELSANNISDEINEYHFTDTSPYESINYYRVKQIDFDGNFEYSELKFVSLKELVWNVEVYPNPVTKELRISSNYAIPGRIKVLDLNGRVMIDVPAQNLYGNFLNISNLPQGVYQLKFISAFGEYNSRFVKK